ncbi:MAG: phosphotyrosine protein phosphatase [SAR86 cluster bacterium]|uniref:Phosphotyrosine protein phosphatase n=1 Tax=SAR86 cluster bacterium TaxID=2030880 RepID=A0A2A4MTI8_9GAMM|nr:MAG: phosphotyrosine protein phosphatase [SAR86 cluster bacterium]
MPAAANTSVMPFFAGINEEDESIFEGIEVEVLDASPPQIRLLRSPMFAKEFACGDTLTVIDEKTAQYELTRRSGNLSLRIFRQNGLEFLERFLTPALEKLDGNLDLKTQNGLVYTIHFSIGFQTIEEILSQAVNDYPDTTWYYGNVYDPADGSTPLNWWQDL